MFFIFDDNNGSQVPDRQWKDTSRVSIYRKGLAYIVKLFSIVLYIPGFNICVSPGDTDSLMVLPPPNLTAAIVPRSPLVTAGAEGTGGDDSGGIISKVFPG